MGRVETKSKTEGLSRLLFRLSLQIFHCLVGGDVREVGSGSVGIGDEVSLGTRLAPVLKVVEVIEHQI